MNASQKIPAATRAGILASVRSGISKCQTARDFGVGETSVRRIVQEATDIFSTPSAVQYLDKKTGEFNWRAAIKTVQSMQKLRQNASVSQRTATVRVNDVDGPIGVMIFGDHHIGAGGTDYSLFLELTDMLLNTPNLYCCLVGDHVEMAIKLRGVAEVCAQLLDPDLQLRFIEQWINEIKHKVLFATWGNHESDRTEAACGSSPVKNIFAEHVPFFNGIGHADLLVGKETYKLAASHKFNGVTQMDSTAGCKKYLRMEYPEGEIALQGDCHRTGVSIYNEGGKTRAAITSGTLNVRSLFAERYFSIRTSSAFPVIAFWPDKHQFVPFFNVQQYMDTLGYASN